jgi:hypothetical protein
MNDLNAMRASPPFRSINDGASTRKNADLTCAMAPLDTNRSEININCRRAGQFDDSRTESMLKLAVWWNFRIVVQNKARDMPQKKTLRYYGIRTLNSKGRQEPLVTFFARRDANLAIPSIALIPNFLPFFMQHWGLHGIQV